jgi:molecular chaperone GrpE
MADETKQPEQGPVAEKGATPEPSAVPGAEPPAEPAQPIAEINAAVETLKGQVADLTDRLLRAHADLDNLRKRAEREKEETAKYAITRFARDVVTVADNFERAVQAVPQGATDQDPALKSLVDGVSMTEREFLNVLERFGVKRVTPKGEMFNPHQHQAMMEMQNLEVAPGTILDVFQPGYTIEDRVLRPAMVVVAKGGAKATKPVEGAPAEASVSNDNSPPESGAGAAPKDDETG